MESSRFETAPLAGKRLIVITDAERYAGQVSTLKALTGQDKIRWEEKNNRRLSHFVAEGMVIVAANEPVQSADYTSGLERRRLTVLFDKVVKSPRPLIELIDGAIVGEFAPYVGGVVNWALSMSEREMVDILVGRSNSIQGLLSAKIKRLRETNPLADWADECLIYSQEKNARVNVGKKILLEHITGYQNAHKWLYPSYLTYMDQTSHNHVAIQRFKGLLDDLCRSQLRLDGVSHHRDKDGSHFVGLKLRGLEDNTTPLFIESALKRPDSAAMTGNDTKVTDQVIDNDEDYKDDILYNYSIKKKEEEKKGSPSSFLSSLPAIEKEWEAKTPSSPSSSSVTTTYSDAPPSGSVRSVIDPQLPMDGGGACPSCRGRKVKHSVSDSMCMACGHRFETGYRS